MCRFSSTSTCFTLTNVSFKQKEIFLPNYFYLEEFDNEFHFQLLTKSRLFCPETIKLSPLLWKFKFIVQNIKRKVAWYSSKRLICSSDPQPARHWCEACCIHVTLQAASHTRKSHYQYMEDWWHDYSTNKVSSISHQTSVNFYCNFLGAINDHL